MNEQICIQLFKVYPWFIEEVHPLIEKMKSIVVIEDPSELYHKEIIETSLFDKAVLYDDPPRFIHKSEKLNKENWRMLDLIYEHNSLDAKSVFEEFKQIYKIDISNNIAKIKNLVNNILIKNLHITENVWINIKNYINIEDLKDKIEWLHYFSEYYKSSIDDVSYITKFQYWILNQSVNQICFKKF